MKESPLCCTVNTLFQCCKCARKYCETCGNVLLQDTLKDVNDGYLECYCGAKGSKRWKLYRVYGQLVPP